MKKRFAEGGQPTLSEFAMKIQEKKLPIPTNQAVAFEKFHTANHAPQGFLDRVVAACSYLDEKTFASNLEQMAARIRQRFEQQDYNLLMEHNGGSSDWIYKKLLALGIQPAAAIFARSQAPSNVKYLNLREQKPKGPVVAIDDWSISSKQLRWTFDELPYDQERYVYLMTITDSARQALNNRYGTIDIQTLNPDIQTLEEALLEEDFEYIKVLEKASMEGPDYNSLPEELSLSWSFYVTPDNIPSLFLGRRKIKATKEAIPGLITHKSRVF